MTTKKKATGKKAPRLRSPAQLRIKELETRLERAKGRLQATKATMRSWVDRAGAVAGQMSEKDKAVADFSREVDSLKTCVNRETHRYVVLHSAALAVTDAFLQNEVNPLEMAHVVLRLSKAIERTDVIAPSPDGMAYPNASQHRRP